MATIDFNYVKGTTGGLIRKVVEVTPSDDPDAGGFGPNGSLWLDPIRKKRPILAVGLRVEKQGLVNFVDADGDEVQILMGDLDELTCFIQKVLFSGTTSGTELGNEGRIFGMLI